MKRPEKTKTLKVHRQICCVWKFVVMLLLITTGIPVFSQMGAEFVISQDATVQMRILDATWHAATGQCLVVWSEHPDHSVNGMEIHSGDDEIRGQLVNLDSTLAGGDFLISEGGSSKDFPQVAHFDNTLDPAQQMSLVVWMDSRDGGSDIWGQLITPEGNAKHGANFKISGADPDLFPALAYGQIQVISGGSVWTGNGHFLVVWERQLADDHSQVYGQIIRGAASLPGGGNPGDLVGGNFAISTNGSGFTSAPSVSFDPVNDQFLVVWTDDRAVPSDDESDIWGQLVDTDGNIVGANFQISSQSGAEYAPGVLYHPEQQEYMVIWNLHTTTSSESDVHAQRISPGGVLTGGVINVAVTADQEEFGDPVIDRDTGSYVIPLTTGPTVVDRSHLEIVKINRHGDPVGVRQDVATETTLNKGPSAAVYCSTVVGPGAGIAAVSEVLFVWRDARSASDPDGLKSQDIYGRMVEVKPDTDGDGLLDTWETNNFVDMNDNGVLDAGDFDFGALPLADQPDVNQKDIYVEVDWMSVDVDNDGITNGDPDQPGDHDHAPVPVAGSLPTGTNLDVVINAFANAPVNNPGPNGGINLHLDLGGMGGGGAIPETLNVDFFAANSFEAVKAANFAPERSRVFHYSLFKHEGAGRAEIWGNDFWVGGGNNALVAQLMTFMHEFGHNLGLRHGGNENSPNYKPNYFSIMSYTFSLTGIPPGFRADYSAQDLPDLDESNLDEGVTLGDGNDRTIFSNGGVTVGPNANTAGNVNIDWDQDGTPNETGANVGNNNINNFGFGSPANELLTGFNDWENLRYNWRNSPHVDDNIHFFHEEEDNTEEQKEWIQDIYGDPSLSLSKTGTESGIPGDPVVYTIVIANSGDGPARNVEINDTWPAGITYTGSSMLPVVTTPNGDGSLSILWRIDTLQAGESVTLELNGTIDFPPASDEVVNTAVASGQNVLGEPVPSLEDSQTTRILYPAVEMTKTGPAAVNAGEAILYTITYENTGTADAKGIVIIDTLPPGVYYSPALDLGEGPGPDSFTYNGDGTTTLLWNIDTLSPGSGVRTITYSARPNLLFLPGETVSNNVVLDFSDANANDYDELNAVSTTTITYVAPGEIPRSLGYVRNHEETWSAETLARIQATDTRYDINNDGLLSADEMEATLAPGGNQPKMLTMQLLTSYYNLATREINAGTLISSETSNRLGLYSVADAILFAVDTLKLPVNKNTRRQYSDATDVLDEINNNVSEIY